jgi:uncharacterized MnhB-related membrane protein
MSAQTTINRPAQGTHYGLLGAPIVAVAVAIVGLALAVSLLGSFSGSRRAPRAAQ